MNVLIRNLPKRLDQHVKLTQAKQDLTTKSEAIIYLLSKQVEAEAPSFFENQLIENQHIIQEVLERNQLVLRELLEAIQGGD